MLSPYIKKTAINFFSYFLIGLSVYILVALLSYNTADSGFFNKNSSALITNLGGPLGANISDFLFTLIGYSSYLLLLIGCVWSAQIIFDKDKYNSTSKVIVRIASSLILLISCSSILEYYFTGVSGGATGKLLFGSLSSNIGTVGGLIFFTLFLVPASSNAFNFSWLNILQLIGKYLLLTGAWN